MFYQHFIRPFLFRISRDPEVVHEQLLKLSSVLARYRWLTRLCNSYFRVDDFSLQQNIFGADFPNPVGLAAGFDKSAQAFVFLQALGFGFIEIGTVTAHPQEGNPRPRIFRLAKDQALINRMGFNNEGAEIVAKRLMSMINVDSITEKASSVSPRTPSIHIPLGISLGKSKITLLKDALSDYLYSLRMLCCYGDYFVINVSSPNTPGLRKLQEKDQLDELLSGLIKEREILSLKVSPASKKPLLLKIAPDLTFEALDEVIELCLKHSIDGIIAVNTTVSREGLSEDIAEEGGLSGKPLFKKARECVEYIYRNTHGKLPIIGVGGIMNAEEAYSMIKAGACLIQIYTALIYQGPLVVRRINQGLVELLKRDGFSRISDAVGTVSH